MIEITFSGESADKYLQQRSSKVLGRRYDNNAVSLHVTFPEAEVGNECTMFVKRNGEIIDFYVLDQSNIVPINDYWSQYPNILIGFMFKGENGYVKNSSYEVYYFEEALKPENFVPSLITAFHSVMEESFVDVYWKEGSNNILVFVKGDGATREFDLTPFVQEQADFNETDPTSDSFIKNKPDLSVYETEAHAASTYATKGEVSATYATKESVASTYATKTEVQSVQAEIPTKTSDLTNDSNYTTESAMTSAIANAVVDAKIYADNKDTALKNAIDGEIDSLDDRVTQNETDIALKANDADLSTIAKSGNLSDAIQDSTHRTVTDTEKTTWNTSAQRPIPTKTSDLTNDSDFVTSTYVDSKIVNVYTFKGSVEYYSNLPSSGMAVGDTYNVETETGIYPAGSNFAWTGTTWDALGGSIDLSIYPTKTDVSSTYATKAELSNYARSSDLSTIATSGNLSDAVTDSDHRTVTDSEKAGWNGKQNELLSGTGIRIENDTVYNDAVVFNGVSYAIASPYVTDENELFISEVDEIDFNTSTLVLNSSHTISNNTLIID